MKTIRYGRIVISTILLLMITTGLMLCLLPAQAEPLDTYHSPWNVIRATATEDGANFAAVYDLAGGEGNFANKGATAFHITPMRSGATQGGVSKGGAWDLAICGGLADNDTFSFTIVAWSQLNGMLQVIAEGNGIIGTQDVVIYPVGGTATNIWWADTLVLDETTKWKSVSVLNSGDNEIAMIHIDMAGWEWVQVVIYDADGSGTEANNLTVFGKRY